MFASYFPTMPDEIQSRSTTKCEKDFLAPRDLGRGGTNGLMRVNPRKSVAQVARVLSSRAQVRHLRNSPLQPENETNLLFLSEQPAGEEDHTQQEMNPMISLAEVEWPNHPHPVSAGAQRHSQNSEREIDDTENK